MSALALQAALAQGAAPAVGVKAEPGAKSEPETGFAALLKQLRDPKPEAPQAAVAAAAPLPKDGGDIGALQSLEAALASLAAMTPPATAGDAKVEPAAAKLDGALSAAASALEATGWNASGKTPLKALLEADPALGLTDFQIKTHLAPAGATPARTGAAPLGPQTAWSPLEAAKAALVEGAPHVDIARTRPDAAAPAIAVANPVAPAPAVAPGSAPIRFKPPGHPIASNHPGAPLAAPRPPSPSDFVAAVTAGDGASTRREQSNGAGPAPLEAVQASAPDTAAPLQIIAFAELPAFIANQAADQAAELSAAATPAGADPAAPAAKAAQAVKELHIALDPADLGEMTLKLRLANGKLSVTIAVANPQTMSAIEGDRDLIAARLASGDQSLEALTIQRQAPTNDATQETGAANGSAKDDGSSDKDGAKESGDRPKPRPRGGAGAGGFMV